MPIGPNFGTSLPASSVGTSQITDGSIIDADINASAAIDASKIADGSVSNTEFQYLGTATSDIQTQIGTKVTSGGALGTPSSGTLTNCTFPTLNQNTTGTAANLTAAATLPSGCSATNLALTTPTLGVAAATSIALGGGTALANYVEGTFSPTVTLVGGAGNTVPVYVTNSGRYTRIGNRVFVTIQLSGDGGAEGAGTGQVNIALPITASSSQATVIISAGYGNNTTEYEIYVGLSGSATTVMLYYPDAFTSYQNFSGVDQNAASRAIKIQFSYEV